jgi:UDP-N-acetylglucosamine diphosphorylase/glucosamine-1-phosphate N-acetyltransferase
MPAIILFEDEHFLRLLPLTLWRSVFELRLGRRTILERATQQLGRPPDGIWVRDWIADVAQQRCGLPCNQVVAPGTALVNARWMMQQPLPPLPAPVVGICAGEIAYIHCDPALANRLAPHNLFNSAHRELILPDVKRMDVPGWMIRYPWDIVASLGDTLREEWSPADAGACDDAATNGALLERHEHIHVGHRARLHPTAVIDAQDGPIFIDDDVIIAPHAVIEGPCYLGPGTRINPHAWLHGPNAIGPVCKIGGEVDGCVFQGHSNKQHGGFLGHSFVGSWVNLGAGTVNSDLKNTYGPVRAAMGEGSVDTGLTFFGATIGDHVKTAIQTAIPTGASIGMASVIAVGGPIPKFVPAFSWVTPDGIADGDAGRLLDGAVKMALRRNVEFTDAEVDLFLDLPTRVRGLVF